MYTKYSHKQITQCAFFNVTDAETLGLEAGSGLAAWKLNEQLYPCDVCGKVFGRQQTLSRHLLLHTGNSV